MISLWTIAVMASGCANPKKQYEEFEQAPHKTYTNSTEAFKAVKPTVTLKVNESETIEFSDSDPVLTLDPSTGNKGYFKVLKFTIPTADTYLIRGMLNCRCFGKLSGKNVVIPRMYVWDTQDNKIIASKAGLQKDHSFWAGDEYYNKLEIPLKPGTHFLLVAVDNTTKGGDLFSVQSYGASSTVSTPLFVSISSAPTGKVDLIIQSKTALEKK